MRIAFIDSWLQAPAAGSGTAVAIGGLEAALRERGHLVDRLAPVPDRWPLTLRRLRFNLLLSRHLQRSTYDLVVGFDIDGCGFAVAPNKPYVCSIKGVIAEELQHERGRVWLLFQIMARIEGWNARRAHRVLTDSAYARAAVHQHYRVPLNRLGLVPEGIDLAHWQATAAELHAKPHPHPTILCVARQYHRKHVDDLLSAAALLRRHLPEVNIRIVGDGPEHSALLQQADELGLADCVTFLQDLSFHELVLEYIQADLFCLPSRQEGFGIVFLEAMACCKPIVSTNCTAIPELVVHGETGILVAPGDVEALAGALFLLLTDDARRVAYGRAGRDRVAAYTWQHSADRFLSEITPLLDTT
ncbi:MAG: glycosyltransferase family 4 protein [Herpetosiphonaceae bacterium]|nr:glycosyltransferase family 4 protein [Herpetosiphonaceae bacterium]